MADIMERVALLLNQAENSSGPEAEAFMDRAQKLITLYSIDEALARKALADRTKRQTPIQRTITIANRVGNSNRVQNNAAEMVDLFLRIAGANDVTCNIAYNSAYVITFGFPTDIDLCEALWASLATQMVDAALKVVKTGEYKSETTKRYNRRTCMYEDRPVDARIFKTSFYKGFIKQISVRLKKARNEAIEARDEARNEAAADSSSSLVLVEKRDEVAAFYKANSNAKGSWRGSVRNSGSSFSGREAGRAAGEKARLSSAIPLPASRQALA